MTIPPKPPRDDEERLDEPNTESGLRARLDRFGERHPILAGFLRWNVLFVLASAVTILLTSEPDIQVDPKKALRHLGVVVFTVAFIDLFWHAFVSFKHQKRQDEDRKRIVEDVHRQLQELYKIKDTAVLAVDTHLSLPSRIEECSGSIFIVKIYLPEAKKFFDALKLRIRKNEIEKITLVFLDNRPETPGERLHQERAETMDRRKREDYQLELRSCIKAACYFARDLLEEPGLRKTSPKEFKVYLCNQLPTVSVTQLSSSRAYLAFFFYNVNSVDSPQFHIDLDRKKSSIVKAYNTHRRELLSRIKQQELAEKKLDPDKRRKYIFNLRDIKDIEELEQTQEIPVILNVPDAPPGSNRPGTGYTPA